MNITENITENDSLRIYMSKILWENHKRVVFPLIRNRDNLIGRYYSCLFNHKEERYDDENIHSHKIVNAFELSSSDCNWCSNGYIWEGIVLELEGRHSKTMKGTIHNFVFLGSLNEKNIEEQENE